MKPVFTFGELREVEKKIIEKDGVPSLILMENAGKNAFEILCVKYPDIADYSIFIFCGKGNNAGDGFVIARQLAINGIEANIINVANASELKGDALTNYEVLKKLQSDNVNFIPFVEFGSNKPNPLGKGKVLVIDAILGSGVRGKLSEGFKRAINFINSAVLKNKKLSTVSIDVPSGLMTGEQVNPVVNADVTVTMASVKSEMLFGQGKQCSGEIFVVPIGITGQLLENYNSYGKHLITFDDVVSVFPRRKKSSYKYSNGKALLIGGSGNLSGAIIMSAISASKSGAGSVTAAFPKSISAYFGRKLFDITKLALDETTEQSISGDSYENVRKKIEWSDAVLIGPGISLNPETKNFVFDVIRNCTKPLVVDADALAVLAEDINVLNQRKSKSEIILTPHLGEFSKLSRLPADEITSNRFGSVKEFALRHKVNVVMKSETSFCCTTAGEIYINPSGSEVLASAGSGDVLSGLIVSVLAQAKNPADAMICGCYLHGLLGEIYFEKFGSRQTAMQRDLIKLIPEAIKKILN